jgi:hypothetical protein
VIYMTASVRQANFGQIWDDQGISDAVFSVKGWIISGMKTDSGSVPIKRSIPPSQANAHANAQCRHLDDRGKPHSTNDFAYAKTGEQAAAIGTKGNKRRRESRGLGDKLASSFPTRGPSSMTTMGRSGVCGLTVIVAAKAGVVASRTDAIETRRRIHP